MVGLVVKHFNLKSLKDWQSQIIQAALEGKNTLVVQPTGSGKSLCFQLPSLLTSKMTVVLTPTISLMKDQCQKLEGKGISATYLGSSQTDLFAVNKMNRGDYSIVYVTPEKFFDSSRISPSPSPEFKEVLEAGRVGLLAIDEVHLVSAWKTFRLGLYRILRKRHAAQI